MNALDTALADMAVKQAEHERAKLRRKADAYQRDARTLYYWTLPPTRVAVMRAVHRPGNPASTKALCRAIWADLQTVRNMPDFYKRRDNRIKVLRELFAGECWLYRNQTRRVAQAAE